MNKKMIMLNFKKNIQNFWLVFDTIVEILMIRSLPLLILGMILFIKRRKYANSNA